MSFSEAFDLDALPESLVVFDDDPNDEDLVFESDIVEVEHHGESLIDATQPSFSNISASSSPLKESKVSLIEFNNNEVEDKSFISVAPPSFEASSSLFSPSSYVGIEVLTGNPFYFSLAESEVKVATIEDCSIPESSARLLFSHPLVPSSLIEPKLVDPAHSASEALMDHDYPMPPTPPEEVASEEEVVTCSPVLLNTALLTSKDSGIKRKRTESAASAKKKRKRVNDDRRRATVNRSVRKHRAVRKIEEMREKVEETKLTEELEKLRRQVLDIDPLYVFAQFTPPIMSEELITMLSAPRRPRRATAPTEAVRRQWKKEKNNISQKKVQAKKKYEDDVRTKHIEFLKEQIKDSNHFIQNKPVADLFDLMVDSGVIPINDNIPFLPEDQILPRDAMPEDLNEVNPMEINDINFEDIDIERVKSWGF